MTPLDFKRVLCLVVFLHDIVLDLAVGAFASSSSMVGSEIAKLALSWYLFNVRPIIICEKEDQHAFNVLRDRIV